MKFRKVLLLIAIGLVTLTGCSVNEENGNVNRNISEVTESNKVSLNVTQADLIADITDNEKYLNKDLFHEVDTLDDSDNISIIVSLNSSGLADTFNSNNNGYSSLSEFVNSQNSYWSKKKMMKTQEELAKILVNEGYINSVNHSYTTLFDGFSATTTYGQFKKLQKAGYDIKLTISEVYSLPEYNVTSNSSYEAVTNFVKVYGTGIFDSSGCGYDGNNTSVAILDSGFDIHHPVFQNMPSTPMISRQDVEQVLYDTEAYSYFNNIKVQDVYMNSKIPFVYDYADKDPDVAPYDSEHGTHVAGIIGGSDEVITGVAVNTQLVLMKVFGDINNGAIQEDILAALEDAILLGVDAINLSLGTACGFSRSSDNEYINVVYDKIEAAGISLIVAASNDYSSGYGGESSNTNKATNPDSATVGSPGTFSSTLSVASISGVKSKYVVTDDGYTFFYNNANNNAGEPYDFYDMLFEKLAPEDNYLEVEYVTVPGVGKKVNYSNIDVNGKIALVKRGDTTFEEKAAVALAAGAIGCIIYNNVAGDVFMNAGNKLGLALCSVSMDDGEYLAAKSSGTLILDKSYLAGPFMSEFSSWGPVSDLSLKPEITAHGGSILSAVPGGGYEEISGTSMACPNLCGVVILLRQALKEKYVDITPVELTKLANQLLMSTGTIVLDETGNPYSPRKQGAGLGNLDNALATLAYLSVEDSTKTKLDLGDDPKETGEYELVFQVNNTSNQELKYNLTNLTMTESLSKADPAYVAEKAYMLNPTTSATVNGDGNISGNVITVNPNGTVTVKYTLKLSKQEIKYIQKSFVNGMYVEGFAVLESLNEDGIDLSIPFLAFFGDWTVAPMFDKTYYEVESEAHNGSIDEEDKLKADYYATTPLGTYYYSYIIPLGTYVYEMDENAYDPIPATEEHAAIGYSLETINGITTVYAGLLRNAKKMTTVIKNSETGEIVYEHVKYDEHKAYFSGSVIPGYDLINVTAAEMGLQNNTKYTFSMLAELDYDDGGLSDNLNNTFEFSFYVDYESPIITDAEFYTKYDKSAKEYRYFVDVYVYDNHYAQSIRPFTILDGKLTSLCEYVIPIYSEERGGISKVTVEITDYMDLLQYGVIDGGEYGITNGLGFLVDDYALNQNYIYVTLPCTDSSNITYKPEFVNGGNNKVFTYSKKLNPGDVLDLTYMLTSDDPSLAIIEEEEVIARYFSTLDWASSNENVVKVKNGVIEAVGQGEARITCTTMASDGNPYVTTLIVNVRAGEYESDADRLEDIEFTYFDTLKAFIDGPEVSEIGESGDRYFFTEKPYISFYPSEQVKLGYELEPWNLQDYNLIWSSTNEKVATVDENGVVTAVGEGNANITLKVEVNGRVSSLMASTRVVVKSEFIIEGQTLTAYKGAGGKVVIPNDEGILYIGSFAFSLYTTDYEIKIEDDDYDAAKTPSSNDSVTSVVIPGDIMEIQRYAFYNCTALEKVTFDTNYEGESCPFIKEYAFYGCTSLSDINLDNVNLIGARTFYNCTALENINISKVYAMGTQAFANCTGIKYADITALRNAGPEVFLNCTSLTTIDNGTYTNFSEGMFRNSGLTSITFEADRIPNRCFENCTSLEDATIVRDIVYVGAYAFDGCTNLKTAVFNEDCGTEFIYQYAFNNCTALESVTLPDSEFVIEQNAFNNCDKLDEVVFGADTRITNNLGSIFAGCDALEGFTVNTDNEYYVASGNLLLSADGSTIALAAPGYNYGSYEIPGEISKIASGAFSSIDSLTTLVIGDTVTEIEDYAFANCTNLTTVVLPESGLTIGAHAFDGCTKLSVVENIDSLDSFAPYVFANTALTSLVINDAVISEGAFMNVASLASATINTLEIGANAFANTGLESLVLDVASIGQYAFANCKVLAIVTFTAVDVIGNGAFMNCSKLVSIDAPASYIGDNAFANNTSLESINLSNATSIGAYAFGSTNDKEVSNNLTVVSLPDTLVSIGAYAFYNSTKLTKVTIGNSIEEIGAYAFANCYELGEITTGHAVKVISEGVFAEDENLVTVNISGIEEIGEVAFVFCSKLKNIDLSSVKTIGMQAFYYASSLEEANMPLVTSLADGAFLGASSLVVVNMPAIESIGLQALSYVAVSEIVIPATIKYVSEMAFAYNTNQTKFIDVNGDSTAIINDYAVLDDGVLYTVTENNKYLLSSYPTNKPDKEYEVLFGTVRIEEYAGYWNSKLEKVILPDTLKNIGNMAFYGCTALSTVEFRSVVAPVLEGTITSEEINYENYPEILELVTRYFNFNGYYPYHYGQFKDYVGIANKMSIIVSENADINSYTNILYSLYFDVSKIEQLKSDYESINTNSLAYLDNAQLIPENVSLKDEAIIVNTRTAYNLLDQDLTTYGYSQEYLDNLYSNLVAAEEAWLELKMARVNKAYKYLIEDINALGSNYDFDKLAQYYDIVEALELVDRNDERYVDRTNVDSFKKGFDEYFKNLNEDINTSNDITTLPTTTVNKVGLAVAAVISGASVLGVVGMLIKKRWFF